ncbi:MAG: pyridoxal kinase [Hyphomicrobiales bacterium]|nr:pyridoxal kinase [Hyphomicrobiales bacterium]
MPAILSLSSQVARGLVGHAVNGFVWQRLGFDVTLLPTVILSNRPDYPHYSGEAVRAEQLDAMLGALQANGFLRDVSAIFTGYLPSASHVALARTWIGRLKSERPDIVYCCDPIFGDEPHGLYVAEEAASALRDELVPIADIVTPNRFELGWLTGHEIKVKADAVAAARGLGPLVLATSAPCDEPGYLANIAVNEQEAWAAISAFRKHVPHGTGDLAAALFLARHLRGNSVRDTLALTAGALETVIDASVGRADLALISQQEQWVNASASPVRLIAETLA